MGRTLLLVFILVWCVFVNKSEGIGVTWGRQTTQKLQPSAVVDMLLANGMEKVKFFSLNHGVLSAFSGSNISITISVPNVEIGLVNNPTKAASWIKANVTDYMSLNNVNIKYVLVGSEPYTMINNRTTFVPDAVYNTTYIPHIEPCLGFIEQALQTLGNTDIKATITLFTDVINFPDMEKPSEADFHDDVKDKVLKLLSHLNSTGAPLDLNVYPLFNIREKNFPLEFAFFEDNKKFTIKDGNATYTNVFDFVYDSFIWAMRRYGYGNIPLLIGQVGWPTDGDSYANISTAERFYQGLFKKVDDNIGTPLQSGPLNLYIFALVDENSRAIESRGPSERHYGIYNYDGTPKFDIPFKNARGERKKLESAQGVSYMPRRWCVVDPDKKPVDPKKAEELMNKTCLKADCTSLSYASSCHGMDLEGNLSYAFNMFFQNRNQDVLGGACAFDGYGKVVNEDPSPSKKCQFPLQILSTIFVGGKSEMGYVLPNAGESLHVVDLRFTIFVHLLLFFIASLFI